MDNVARFQKLKEQINNLNNEKVRAETTLEAAKTQKELTIKKLLEVTKTKTIEEAELKAEAISKKLDTIQKEIEDTLNEVEEYEALN